MGIVDCIKETEINVDAGVLAEHTRADNLRNLAKAFSAFGDYEHIVNEYVIGNFVFNNVACLRGFAAQVFGKFQFNYAVFRQGNGFNNYNAILKSKVCQTFQTAGKGTGANFAVKHGFQRFNTALGGPPAVLSVNCHSTALSLVKKLASPLPG